MRTVFITFVVFVASFHNVMGQQPTEIVHKFGDLMQKWCGTDDIAYHPRILELAPQSGDIKCLVDDKIVQDAVDNDTTGFMAKGTKEIATYLNIFQNAIIQGQEYEMSNIKACPDFVAPTVFKDETPPSFVSANLTLSGSLVYDVTDLFYVRGGRITKIIDYSSDNSLGKALELYSHRKYEEAFKMFRKLAYSEFGNFDAQYYMVVMEIKKQGCSYLNRSVRDKEIVWFVYKNYLANNREAIKLAVKYPMDESMIDYAHYKSIFEWMMRCKQPMASGLMMSFDAKTLTSGFVNEQGKLVVPYGLYSLAFPYHEGRSMVISKVTKRCGFIDEKGNEMVPMIYDNALCDFYKGKTWCVKDGDAYLVDNQGKVLKIVPGHGELIPYTPVGEYAMLYKTDTLFDIYDYNGNLCYENYSSWSFDSATGVVMMKNDQGKTVLYHIAW